MHAWSSIVFCHQALVELCQTDLVWKGNWSYELIGSYSYACLRKFGFICICLHVRPGDNIDERLHAAHVQFVQQCRLHKTSRLCTHTRRGTSVLCLSFWVSMP